MIIERVESEPRTSGRAPIAAARVKRLALVAALSLLGACSGAPPAAAPRKGELSPLGQLMKNEVNPTFSKLIVLVFHADTLDMEPQAVAAELRQAAGVLQRALARLRDWGQPPGDSREAREVFYTYASSVDRATQRLVAAVERNDNDAAAGQLEQIAGTCNSCHHFFRLRLRDSVVPSR